MDNGAEKKEEKRGLGLPFGEKLSGEKLIRALAVCLLGFLFSRLHIVFSARPMAIALVAFLSSEVYFALLGGIVGGFSSGGGFISAISLLITLFVRVIIGTADKERELFSESLVLRMSAGLLGGFVFAVYEWLISGISVSTALYGASMLLIPPAAVFLLSGLTEHPTLDIFLGRAPLPRLTRGELSEKLSSAFFYVSALLFLHMTCRSLAEVSIFGIDLAFIFAAAVTLLIASRHGAVLAGGAGFIATLGTAGVQSVSFALLGLLSGLLFPFGAPVSLAAGGLAFCFWAGYSGGLSGLLSTLPELVISIALMLPFIKGRAPRAEDRADGAEAPKTGADTLSRVGTMALSYRGKYAENTERFIASVEAISHTLGVRAGGRPRPARDEYRAAVMLAVKDFCAECEHGADCERKGVCPALSRVDILAEKLFIGERISSSDINTEDEFCERRAEISKRINERASSLEYANARAERVSGIGEELLLLSRMMSEARERDRADVKLNSEMSALAEAALTERGIKNFSVRVFGERRMRVFLAIEDADGRIISSRDVREALSLALSAELDGAEYYRDGGVSMLELSTREKYSAAFSYKIRAGEGSVSGDSAAGIRTADGAFYGILADGMGRGEAAHEASEHLLSLTKNLLSFGVTQDTLVKFLSCLMARRGEVHSTLDLFRFDLYTGEASFIKCGSAPSYVKRDGTLYRIGSEGTPIGVGSEALGERVRVEVKAGDLVVMTSDGVGSTQGGQLKFIERMSCDAGESLSALADELVSLDGDGGDDRTALVIRINESIKTAKDT